jgi:Protein of unknown function (DUF3592)
VQPPNDLGPFAPPKDYQFEPEFQDQPPRSIPPELRLGRYARGKRRAVWGFLAAGLIFLACSPLPIIRTWGLYFLPLQYLLWIGAGCLAISLVALISYLWRGGPYRYVREGEPLVARILGLTLQVKRTYQGQPQAYHFVARIEYRDPTTNELTTADTASNEISSTFKEWFTTSYRVGEYATAVYLPSNPTKTLRLYGFLDLRPDFGLVRRQAKADMGIVGAVLAVCIVFAFVGGLLWAFYAYSRYAPVELTFSQGVLPFAIGIILLGGPFLILAITLSIREQRKRKERNEQALASGEPIELEGTRKHGRIGFATIFFGLLIMAGAILLSGGIGLCLCFTANALLDTSPAQKHIVRVDNLIMETHKYIVRTYKIEYHFLDGDLKKHDFLSTPDHLDQFSTNVAIAEVHAGYLGWPWVKDLKPVPGKINIVGQKDEK